MNPRITQVLLPVAVTVGAGWLCYFNSFQTPLVFDDSQNIVSNPSVHLERLSFDRLQAAAFQNPTPRPIAYLTFAANYYFGGLNVRGYHLVNLLIHCLNGMLVYGAVNLFLSQFCAAEFDGARFVRDRCEWVALVAAVLFVVHPVQTQSVTYIVQRMASLCTTFYLAGLMAFFMGRAEFGSKRVAWWSAAFLLWLLALGTKQMAVTFPLAIFLVEWILFQKGDRRWFRTCGKYIVGTLLLMGIVVFVFKGADAHKMLTRGYTKRDFTLSERLLTEGRVMLHYVTLIVLPLPSRLTLIYDFPISHSLLSPPATLLCWMTIVGVVVWSLLYAYRYPILCFSILWFFLHLAVESTFIPLELVYEHRLYLPLVGVCLLAAFLLARVFPRSNVALAVSATGLCAFLIWGTHERNKTWQTAVGLWQDNISKQPNEPRSWFNLAREHMAVDDRAAATRAFAQVIKLEPRAQQAYFWLAVYLKDRGEYEQALELCEKGLAISPKKVFGKSAFDQLVDFRAELMMMRGDYRQTLKSLSFALKRSPTPRRYTLRAAAHLGLDQPQEAISDFRAALDIDPDYFLANNNYAWLLATHPDQQIANGTEAVRLAIHANEITDYGIKEAITTLAAAHARVGSFEAAARWQAKALELADESDRARLNRGLQLYQRQHPLIDD